MIDLEKLDAAAHAPGKTARVSRSWLRQVQTELVAARALRKPCGNCFGLPPGVTL